MPVLEILVSMTLMSAIQDTERAQPPDNEAIQRQQENLRSTDTQDRSDDRAEIRRQAELETRDADVEASTAAPRAGMGRRISNRLDAARDSGDYFCQCNGDGTCGSYVEDDTLHCSPWDGEGERICSSSCSMQTSSDDLRSRPLTRTPDR